MICIPISDKIAANTRGITNTDDMVAVDFSCVVPVLGASIWSAKSRMSGFLSHWSELYVFGYNRLVIKSIFFPGFNIRWEEKNFCFREKCISVF